jgi:hypothetical protein
VPGQVLDGRLPLAVLELLRLLEHPGAEGSGPVDLRVDVSDPHLEQVGHHSRLGRLLLTPHVGHDHRAVDADPQLRAMVLADPNPLDEPERLAQPYDRRPYIRVDQDRDHCRCRQGTVRQHPANLGPLLGATQGAPVWSRSPPWRGIWPSSERNAGMLLLPDPRAAPWHRWSSWLLVWLRASPVIPGTGGGEVTPIKGHGVRGSIGWEPSEAWSGWPCVSMSSPCWPR